MVLDKKLWTEAVFTSKSLDIWEILKRLRYLRVCTKSLKICGDSKKEFMESRPLKNRQTFKEIIKRIILRAPFIEDLHFHQIWFDWTRDFSITKFPANLKSLVFTNCIMPKDRTRINRTFTNIFDHLPHLEEVKLEYCNFFEPNDLMPLSKIQKLKILSLRGCKKLRNCVPYISLSCRFGFKKLEILDIRETMITDSELQCLNVLKTLKELYLEHVDTEINDEDSDDDDDFQIFRAMRRRPTEPTPNEQESRNVQPSTSGGNSLNANSEEHSANENLQNPSSSNDINIEHNHVDSINAPSSPENLSDSIPSDDPVDEIPSRTIFIQANITENPNQNARLQVVISDDIPHARYVDFTEN